MEAGTLSGDKAQRIVDAMRASVATRGAAGSTFDHVAREAGVSRGLLHYYFGSKERLLVEVAKRDSEVRFAAMAAQLGRARNADELVGQWVRSLQATVRHEPQFVTMLLELYDSQTSQLLARVIDPEDASDYGIFVWQSRVGNLAAADAIMKKWSDTLRHYMEAAHDAQ